MIPHPYLSNPPLRTMTQTTALEPSLTLNKLLAQAIEIATPSFLSDNLENSWKTLNALPDGSLRVHIKMVPDEAIFKDYEPGYYYGLIVELVTYRGQLLAHDSIWGIREPNTFEDGAWQSFGQHLSELAAELIRELNQPGLIRRLLANEIENLSLILQAIQ